MSLFMIDPSALQRQPEREAEIIGFIKGEPNKTLAFMQVYESAVEILSFHDTALHPQRRPDHLPAHMRKWRPHAQKQAQPHALQLQF